MKVIALAALALAWAIQSPDAVEIRSRLNAYLLAYEPHIGMPPFDAVVRVDFKNAASLGLLVPAELEETFFVGRSRPGTDTAKYTNYRKFQTSARIVPPPP